MTGLLYLFLLLVAAVGAAIYWLAYFQNVPGAAEERFGKLEPLPPDLGKWRFDDDSDAGREAEAHGLRREVRYLYHPGSGLFRGGRLVRQVRYRSITTNKIERIDPEETIKRRRVKVS